MGMMQRRKGKRVELLLVNLFKSWGLHSLRVPLSGATDYAKGDVDVYRAGRRPTLDAPYICEVKARKEHPAWLRNQLGNNDILALKSDRDEFLFVIPERLLRELLTQ